MSEPIPNRLSAPPPAPNQLSGIALGDREVTCYLTDADGKPITASYRALPSPSEAAP